MVKITLMSSFSQSSLSHKPISTYLNSIASFFLKRQILRLSVLESMMGVYYFMCSQPSQLQMFKINSIINIHLEISGKNGSYGVSGFALYFLVILQTPP